MYKGNNVALDDIEHIDVTTNRAFGVGFHEKEPERLCDREFSIPYQVSAAILAGDKGPNWYSDKVAKSPEFAEMVQRVTLSFDEEAEEAHDLWMSKVIIRTKSGRQYSKRVDGPTNTRSDDEVREKFITTTSQVIDRGQVDKLMSTIENLERWGTYRSWQACCAFLPPGNSERISSAAKGKTHLTTWPPNSHTPYNTM